MGIGLILIRYRLGALFGSTYICVCEVYAIGAIAGLLRSWQCKTRLGIRSDSVRLAVPLYHFETLLKYGTPNYSQKGMVW